MLSVFIGILTVVIVIVSVLLILIVLMQRPKQEGLGAAFGGGMMDSVAGAHTTDVLQKGTTWLAGIFLGAAVLHAVLTAQTLKQEDPGELLPAAAAEPAIPPTPPNLSDLPGTTPPTAPAEPATDAPAPAAETTTEEKPAPAPTEAPKADGEAADPAPEKAPAPKEPGQ